MRRFFIFACLAVPLMSQAIVIDDFNIPYSRTISTGTWVDYQTDPTLFTGERDVQFEALLGSGGSPSVEIGQGQLTVTNGPQGRSWVQLEYDGVGDEEGNTGPGRTLRHASNPTHSFPEGTSKIRFFVASCNMRFTVGMSLVQNGIPLYHNSRTVDPGVDQVVDVPLSTQAFAECDAIILDVYVSRPGAEVTLTSVALVPEASSLIGVASGLALLSAGRLRKAKP